MIILGLHFGHDAGVAVLRDGRIVSCVIRERQTRVKHAMTLDVQTIWKALKDAGVKSNQIDFCAITSTQGVELIVDSSKDVSISSGGKDRGNGVPCKMDMDKSPALTRRVFPYLFEEHSGKSEIYSKELYSKYFPEYKTFEGKENEFSGWMDEYVSDDLWHPPKTLKTLSATQLASSATSDFLRYGFHYPASISLRGRLLPAFFINHHACHAASSYYQSGLSKAAILVQDGGNGLGYDSGMFYYAEKNRIYPVAPHHSILGFLYDQVASYMNLGQSSAGKLMGLAAYGRPSFYDSKFLGNLNDLVNVTHETDITNIVEHWLYHCLSLAKDMGYDLDPFGVAARMTAPVNVDIAASTQKLFEETTLALIEILHNYLRKNGIVVDALCLSGGNALNCPLNSRAYREGRFKKVFVEPGCDDSGLAIGAALDCYHNLLDQPLPKRSGARFNAPFLGPRVEESDILSAIESFADRIHYEKMPGWALDAARELEKNRVIGWFYGRSEIGPRALGHRSILADARDPKNWERVNKVKKRELWRPFAPAVLESEAEKWFSGTPLPSPYMLFNATVKSKEAPAITHVDGSARIQTVSDNDGAFHDLLVEFFRMTGVPILLNTSFNGPGEPIVETPADAVRFFVNSELDILYLDSYKLKRKPIGRKDGAAKKSRAESQKTTAISARKFMADFEKTQGQRLITPYLIEEGYKGFNIVSYGRQSLGVRQSIGEIDFSIGLEKLRERYDEGDVVVRDSVETVRAQIDGMDFAARQHRKLREADLIHHYRGFNLVAFRGKVWGLNISVGEVDFQDAERIKSLMASGHLFEAATLEEIRSKLDRLLEL
jgi:carbamoyltransferase